MGYRVRRQKTAPSEMMSREVKCYLPKSLYDLLKFKSEKAKLPMSRLLAFAVDKEIGEGEAAFAYDCTTPETIYVEGAYTDEGGRIYRYLLRNGSPMSVDQMILHRRDIGVPDKTTLLLGIRELLTRNTLVEQVYPSWSHFRFDESYKVIAIKTSKEEKRKKEIAKLEEQLQKLKGSSNGPFGTETPDSEETKE